MFLKLLAMLFLSLGAAQRSTQDVFMMEYFQRRILEMEVRVSHWQSIKFYRKVYLVMLYKKFPSNDIFLIWTNFRHDKQLTQAGINAFSKNNKTNKPLISQIKSTILNMNNTLMNICWGWGWKASFNIYTWRPEFRKLSTIKNTSFNFC